MTTVTTTPIFEPQQVHPAVAAVSEMPFYSALLLIHHGGRVPIIRDVLLRTGFTGWRSAMQNDGSYMNQREAESVIRKALDAGEAGYHYSFELVEVEK